MKAIEILRPGGPEVLAPCDRDLPKPQAGEMLIAVRASGVNRPDVLQRMGLYPMPPGVSDLPGLEVSGVVAGGDPAELAAAGWSLGDRVCALVAGGGYAQYCVAPIGQCLPAPANLSDIEAAALPETFFTVWQNPLKRQQPRHGAQQGGLTRAVGTHHRRPAHREGSVHTLQRGTGHQPDVQVPHLDHDGRS